MHIALKNQWLSYAPFFFARNETLGRSNNGSLRKQEQAKIPATVLRIWFDGLAGDDVASTL